MPMVEPQTLIIGIFAGLAALASTWMNNFLIAKRALGQSNSINIVAIAVSLGAAGLSLQWGLSAALASMLLQPLLVALGALVIAPELRPNRARFDSPTLRLIWSVGIWQFIAGLSVLMTFQVERWLISLILGNDQLGRFYLVMMFTSFFQLVPAALLNINLPKAVQAASNAKLKNVLRRHLQEIIIYSTLILLAVLTLAPNAVHLLLPQFEDSVSLLALSFPALMFIVLRDNATLALYATRKMRPLLVSSVLLLLSYTALLGIAALTGRFSLEAVVVLRAIAAAASWLYLFLVSRSILAKRE